MVTTIALFLTMKVLVTGQDFQIEDELASIGIDFVRVERDEDVNTKDRALKRPASKSRMNRRRRRSCRKPRGPMWTKRQ